MGERLLLHEQLDIWLGLCQRRAGFFHQARYMNDIAFIPMFVFSVFGMLATRGKVVVALVTELAHAFHATSASWCLLFPDVESPLVAVTRLYLEGLERVCGTSFFCPLHLLPQSVA